MNWISLTVCSTLLGSFGVIYERYLLGHETKKPAILSSLWGFTTAIFFIAPIIIHLSYLPILIENLPTILLGLLSGIFYFLAIYLYYSSVNHNEVSRIIPLMALNPVFVLIFAQIFFKEQYNLNQYFGIIIILIGVIITSILAKNRKTIHQKTTQLISPAAIFLALSAALSFAIKNILIKSLSVNNPPLIIITFWIGLGILISTIIFSIWTKPGLHKLPNRSAIHLFIAILPVSFGDILLTTAITAGQVGMVTFLGRLEILFVFILSQIIQIFRPNWLQEKLSPSIFGQKLFGVILILLGCYLLI